MPGENNQKWRQDQDFSPTWVTVLIKTKKSSIFSEYISILAYLQPCKCNLQDCVRTFHILCILFIMFSVVYIHTKPEPFRPETFLKIEVVSFRSRCNLGLYCIDWLLKLLEIENTHHFRPVSVLAANSCEQSLTWTSTAIYNSAYCWKYQFCSVIVNIICVENI